MLRRPLSPFGLAALAAAALACSRHHADAEASASAASARPSSTIGLMPVGLAMPTVEDPLDPEVAGCEMPPPRVSNRRLGGGEDWSTLFELEDPLALDTPHGQGPLRLHIEAPSRVTTRQTVEVKIASFENASDAPIVVLPPLGGSVAHLRSPSYDLYARRLATGENYRYAERGGHCGVIPSIGQADYVTIPPREKRKIADPEVASLALTTIAVPGMYDVWIVYRFCGHSPVGPRLFLSEPQPSGEDFLRDDVHKGAYASNTVRVEVVAP